MTLAMFAVVVALAIAAGYLIRCAEKDDEQFAASLEIVKRVEHLAVEVAKPEFKSRMLTRAAICRYRAKTVEDTERAKAYAIEADALEALLAEDAEASLKKDGIAILAGKDVL